MLQMIAKIATMLIFFRPKRGQGFRPFQSCAGSQEKEEQKGAVRRVPTEYSDVSGPILGYFGVRKSMENE